VSHAALIPNRKFCTGVRATDGGGLVTETSLNVYVADKNYAPVFETTTIYVPEHQPSWSNLSLLVASDDDPGNDGLIFTMQGCDVGLWVTMDATNTTNSSSFLISGEKCGDTRLGMFELSDDPKSPNRNVSAWLDLVDSVLNYEDAIFAGNTPPTYILNIKIQV